MRHVPRRFTLVRTRDMLRPVAVQAGEGRTCDMIKLIHRQSAPDQ